MCLRNKQWSVASGQWSVINRFIVMVITVVILAAWVSSVIGSAEHIIEQQHNLEAQKIKNPVPSNGESIESGKQLYRRFCASCHGPEAKGDGGLALSGGTPSDLTDDTWDYGSTDGEIFVVIRDGVSSDMLAYKDKLKEEQIWQIVNFLRSIGPKAKEDK